MSLFICKATTTTIVADACLGNYYYHINDGVDLTVTCGAEHVSGVMMQVELSRKMIKLLASDWSRYLVASTSMYSADCK